MLRMVLLSTYFFINLYTNMMEGITQKGCCMILAVLLNGNPHLISLLLKMNWLFDLIMIIFIVYSMNLVYFLVLSTIKSRLCISSTIH